MLTLLSAAGLVSFSFLAWRLRYALALRRLRRAAATFAMPPNMALELEIPDVGGEGRPLETPETPPARPKIITIENAALIDAIGLIYAEWDGAKQSIILAEELSDAVAAKLHAANVFMHTELEQLALVGRETAAFLHHAIDPSLWSWFEHTGGIDFSHLLAHKIQVLQGGAHLDVGAHAIGHAIGPAIPWATLVLSSWRELHLLQRGDTTVGRAFGHVVLDTGFVAGGAAIGGTAGSLALGALAAVGTIATGGIAAAVIGIGAIAGGILGAKASGKLKAMAWEEACEAFGKAMTAFNAEADAARSSAERRIALKVGALKAEFELKAAGLASEFEAVKADFEADEAADRKAFTDAVPAYLGEERDAAAAASAAVEAALRKLGVASLLPFGPGPELHASRTLRAQSLTALETAAAGVSRVTAATFTRAWTLMVTAAQEDPYRRVAAQVLAFVECTAERRQEFRRKHAASQAAITALEAKLAADIEAVEDEIHAEYAQRLNPFVEKVREFFETMRREAAALGKRPA